MSKKGSPYLRYALIFTAWNIVRHSEKFNKYYSLKRSQGKSHYNALGHVAHKLVRILFTLIKKNISYQEEKLEQYILDFNYMKNQEFHNSNFVMPKILV